MKKLIYILLFISSAPTFADTKQVNFLNWANYISPKSIAAFEKKTNIKVNLSYFDGGDMLRAKLLAGGAGYDVIMPALANLPQYIQAHLLQPIKKNQLTNYQLRNKSLYQIASSIDPENQYAVIYTYGTTGIAYNKRMIAKYIGKDIPKDAWQLLFKPEYLKKLQGCGVSFLASPVQVFGITLKYLGYNPNTQDPKALKAATDYLMKIRKYFTYFSNNRYIFDLASGNICIAMAYSGDTLRAEKLAKGAHDHVQLVYRTDPKDMPIWFDVMAIPYNAPHPDAARAFINAMLSPNNAAHNSNFIMQPNAVPKSQPMLAKQLQAPSITPTPKMLKSAFILQYPSVKLQRLISRLWFSVKYGVPLS